MSFAPAPGPLAARVGSLRWVLSLAALTGVTALSVDMSLPAQPTLARDLHVAPEVSQLTLSLFLAGYAVGQLLCGYLSDAFSRRPILLCGLVTYTVAGVGCALSPTIGLLLASRCVQGLGAAAAPVVARAMVRDTQPAASAARMLSSIMAVLALAPMLAPLLGAWLLRHLGWHSIFAALAVIGVVFTALSALTLPETLPRERRARLDGRAIASSFSRFFGARGTLLPTALVCLSFTGQFAFISDSPFVLIDGLHVPSETYAFYFGATALALMGGAALGGRLLRVQPPSRVLAIGAGTLCAGGLLVAVGVRAPSLGALGLVAPMVVYFVGIGLTGPSATAIAMDPVPEIAGTASATIGFLQMVSGAISGAVTTTLGGSDPLVLGEVVATVGVAAVVLLIARVAFVRAAARESVG
jgi:DHA1 family bicyclomycin/chloramphenicol resistance-like MFS transporter